MDMAPVPQPGTPEFAAWFATLPKPPGWDRVHWSDDCACPLGGEHQPGCWYAPEPDPPARLA